MGRITSPQYRKAFILVTTLFFMWGLSYGLIDVLNKHFQETLSVSKAQSGLIQAAYFVAYFVIAIPAGLLPCAVRPPVKRPSFPALSARL